MSKLLNSVLIVFLLFNLASCNKKKDVSAGNRQTMTEGTATLLVDETIAPIIENQVQIFESQYDAKLIIDSKSEAEIIQSLAKDNSQIAILTRKLSEQEMAFFESKKLFPKITPFAKDAIAFITNKSNNDTLIALQDVQSFIQNKNQSSIKELVFDNFNSSTARSLINLAGLKELSNEKVFSFKTNNEVIKYISQKKGSIGVIGLNYIQEPSQDMQEYVDKINVLNVKGIGSNNYFAPSQNNIAEGTYPLARDLYIINCQGFTGLGMGFASFVTSETGQRIVLKSGLVPVKFPSRKIIIRKEINNERK